MNVYESIFGSINEKDIKSYTVETDHGMEITCIEYGCIITSLQVADREGAIENIVLGFDTIEEYLNYSPYFGCVIGRSAGRIEGASFQLDGEIYTLAKNDGENNLHGGPNGFHNIIWDSSYEIRENVVHITFTHTSPDGTDGFPGNLKTTIMYSIYNSNELIISYHASSDKKTVVNLTNHTYFNLSGSLKRTVEDHELTLKSDFYLELDASYIPTGNVIPVENTVFDFRKGQKVSSGFQANDPQTKLVGGGFDHPFLLNVNNLKEITLVDKESGRKVEIETEEPCVVLYTGNSLANDFMIRGKRSEKHLGLCLETQKAPNMFNRPDFPSIIIEANKPYTTKTKYSFQIL
jgi:aldose 1-epimerase